MIISKKLKNKSIMDKWHAYLKYIGQDAVERDENPLCLATGPFFLEGTFCATCMYWNLLNETHLVLFHEIEKDMVMSGLDGVVINHYEPGEESKSYDYTFFGFCKRFPPVTRNSYSLFRQGIFRRVCGIKPGRISSCDFPITEHYNKCGEWKEVEWLAPYKDDYKKLKSASNKK
jgi:hypothetical protein